MSFGSLSEPTKGRIPDRLSPVIEEGFAPYITIDSASGGDYEDCDTKGMVPCNGETIMVMDGAASGNVFIGPIGCLGSTFSKWVSKRKDVSNSVIYLFLKTYYPYFIKANTGSTVPHANSSFIKDMQVFVPYDCAKFSTFFDILFKKIENNNVEIRKLKLLKDRLLPLLINGQATLI